MAISRVYPDLSAEVLVDGRACPEHRDDEGTAPNTTSHYIEAEADELFAVRYHVPYDLFESYSIKAIVRVDGTDMRKCIFARHIFDYYGASRTINSSSAHIRGKDLGQRFRFASLDTHDETDPIDMELQRQLASTGDISVFFHRVTNLRPRMVEKDLPAIREYEKVPEKALKGSSVSYKTTLGPVQRIAPVRWMEADFVDGEENPFAVIRFKYRSKASLKALLIIRDAPHPVPSEHRPVDDLAPAGVANCYRAKEEDRPNLKRERSVKYEDDDEAMIVQARRAKRRCLPTRHDEVIELD